MKIAPLILMTALIVCGCARHSDQEFDRTRLAADAATGSAIRLSDYTPFDWDRVHIFAPYTPATTIRNEVGSRVPFPRRHSEGHCLLVFLSRGRVAAALEEERKAADFAQLFRQGGYSPEEAVFVSEVRGTDHWRYLTVMEASRPALHNARRSPLSGDSPATSNPSAPDSGG